MSKIKKIDTELRLRGKIRCPLCGEENSLSLWDASTHDQCDSREKRRAYVSLEETRAYGRKSGLVFMCPSCTNYIDGYKLKPYLQTNNENEDQR